MDSQALAAYIAAGVSAVTLAGTLTSQALSRRATSRDNEKTLEQQRDQNKETLKQQREQLDTTLKAQGGQLDTTLKARGEQLKQTLAEQRTRTLNERFTTAADKLGSDKPPAIRLAGVHALAGLADDWRENRQTCVDVLCAYLRLPYEPDPGDGAAAEKRLAFRADREVRHTVIRIIGAHLRPGAAESWQNLDLNFTGAAFDGGDFSNAVFSGREVSFQGAVFSGGEVSFDEAEFTGGDVGFDEAEFTGSDVSFERAKFSGGRILFGVKGLNGPVFSGGKVSFLGATFSGTTEVSFHHAKFSGTEVSFLLATFYVDRGLALAKSFGRKYVEFASPSNPVKLKNFNA